MESSFLSANTSGKSAGMFSASPYTTVEILLIVTVAGSLSLITVVGNILVMLSIKVWVCFTPHKIYTFSLTFMVLRSLTAFCMLFL